MTSLRMFELLMAQTWQVGVLAAVVWGIVRICGGDRPHLSHCLWALVLLKCLIPPVWTSPVGLFCWINAKASQMSSVQWFGQATVALQPLAVEPTAISDVTIRIFDPRSSRENSPLQANSPASGTEQQTTTIERGAQCLLAVWLIGCSVSFIVAIARLFLFGRFVRRSSLQRKQADCNASMEQLVHRLSERLQVGRRVRISVLDAAVGPAVYGLIRPTILLPAAIAQNRSLKELEPLVAHELRAISLGEFEAEVPKQLEDSQPLAGQDDYVPGAVGWLAVYNSSRPITTHCTVIDTETATAISKLAEDGERQSVLGVPRITCRNGGSFQVTSDSPWSISPLVVAFDNAARILPLPELGFSGFSLAVHPLIEANLDNVENPNIDLSLVCETCEVTRLDKFTFEGQQTIGADGGKTVLSVEQPNVELKKLAVRHKLQAGESLLISSREALAPQSENKILVVVATCEVVPDGASQIEPEQNLKSNVQRLPD